MMTTLTIELTHEKALNLLKNLEDLKIIRVVKKETERLSALRNKIKEPMNMEAIDSQLKELRNQWQRDI
jgi:DNA-binding HxlR family transcriptional regulator